MSILEAPALGLARPSLDDERTIARVLPDGPDLSCEWRLGDADVVVVVGCTPPPAKYFGLTSYVYRSYEAGVVRTIFGSLGDTLSVGGDGVGNDGNAKFTYVLGLSQIQAHCLPIQKGSILHTSQVHCSARILRLFGPITTTAGSYKLRKLRTHTRRLSDLPLFFTLAGVCPRPRVSCLRTETARRGF